MLQTWDPVGGGAEAVPGWYRGRTTECCKTWDPVGGGTEAVPGQDHRMLQNVGSCERRDVHPFFWFKTKGFKTKGGSRSKGQGRELKQY